MPISSFYFCVKKLWMMQYLWSELHILIWVHMFMTGTSKNLAWIAILTFGNNHRQQAAH